MQNTPFLLAINNKLFIVLISLLLCACNSKKYLMPTPSLYADNHSAGFEKIPAPLQNNSFNILYVTDRHPFRDELENLNYNFQRSRSLAYGNVTIKTTSEISWTKLVTESQVAERTEEIELSIDLITEQARFPETPYPLIKQSNGDIIEDPATLQEARELNQKFHAELSQRLAIAPRKEVLIYVHGVSNTFADAAYALAELWHFNAREMVPILYTWPAGRGGAAGYAYDRESGEFTIFHLKQFLRSLAAHPGIEKIHILAHSRGTDIISTALRELFLVSIGAGKDPGDVYRIENLILVAPDIDTEVLSQRLIAERIGDDIKQLSVYTSAGDRAIRLSQILFSSVNRLGNLVGRSRYRGEKQRIP